MATQKINASTTGSVVQESMQPARLSPSLFVAVQAPPAGALYINRVWDTTAGAFVRWETRGAADSLGDVYPGPGAFGVDTSDYCVDVRLPA